MTRPGAPYKTAFAAPPGSNEGSKVLRIGIVTLIILLAIVWPPAGAVHAAGTDEIKNYAIDILPQEDGSLVDTYAINWCVISNSAGPLTWFTLGMPNQQYQIVDSSGDVASARPDDEGFDYKIRIDLPRDVNAGECINATVKIHQYGMANLDSSTNEISFQFTPGWFNDIPVDLLQVTLHLPSDGSLLKSLDPKPTRQDASQAVWEADLRPGEKFPITVVYDKAAFPGFTPGQAVPAQTSALLPTDPGQSSTYPGSSDATGSPLTTDTQNSSPSLIPGLGLVGVPLTVTSCICLCLVILLILFVLFVVIRALGSGVYRGGGWLGGYPRGGGWLGGGGGGSVFRPGGGGGGFTPRTGGGSGLFGGRGMSCACVSSGCACACAGGGRAGCSRKGFDVSSLFMDRQEKINQ